MLVTCPNERCLHFRKDNMLTRDEMTIHSRVCTYTPARCPNYPRGCDVQLPTCDFDQHTSRDCQYRIITCTRSPHCNSTMLYRDFARHDCVRERDEQLQSMSRKLANQGLQNHDILRDNLRLKGELVYEVIILGDVGAFVTPHFTPRLTMTAVGKSSLLFRLLNQGHFDPKVGPPATIGTGSIVNRRSLPSFVWTTNCWFSKCLTTG